MLDCHSLADIKITENPVLYLPAEIPASPAVTALEQKCHVKVMSLPRRIEKLGDVRPEELATPGLLYLPNPYVVPGGRFNEMYGWDSYFILLGLEADHHEALGKGIVDNFLFEVEHYGSVLNANRTYYLTRSQPPFLTSMIRAVYEDPASFSGDCGRPQRGKAMARTCLYGCRKRLFHLDAPRSSGGLDGAGALLRLWRGAGAGDGRRQQLLSRHHSLACRASPGCEWRRLSGERVGTSRGRGGGTAQAIQLRCAGERGVQPCMVWRLPAQRGFYLGDRAMRESGFDTTSRFEAFSGATHHYAPVCLNSLLYRYERDLSHLAHVLGKPDDAMRWDRRAKAREAAIQRYLWRPTEGVFADYDFVHARPSNYAYLTSLYPLWAGVASREQARQMVAKLSIFERVGGLSMSNTMSGLQWDEPFGWAPANWLAVDGLEATGFHADAVRIAQHFDATVDAGFAADTTIREKYNVVSGNADVEVSAGYKVNVIGFGWTNAVYLKMKEVLQRPVAAAAE